MSKEPNSTGKTKSEQVKLIFSSYKGRKTTTVEFPYRDSIELVAAQNRFYDSILTLAELPPQNEWPRILALSQQASIPSIWQRVRPSPLESNAAGLLTALAFSSRKHRGYLIAQFLKAHSLVVDLRGRPRVAPRKAMVNVRGIQIQKIMDRFQEGFVTVDQARGTRRFSSNPTVITTNLKKKGYNDLEVRTLLAAKSLQDAACKYFARNNHELSGHKGALKLAQNAIAAYKKTQATKTRS
jgi:hypothetical protein